MTASEFEPRFIGRDIVDHAGAPGEPITTRTYLADQTAPKVWRISALDGRHESPYSYSLDCHTAAGDTRLVPASHEVWTPYQKGVVILTPTETAIMRLLMVNQGSVVGREEILEVLLRTGSVSEDPNAHRVPVSRLRSTLGESKLAPDQPPTIETVAAIPRRRLGGYRFAPDPRLRLR